MNTVIKYLTLTILIAFALLFGTIYSSADGRTDSNKRYSKSTHGILMKELTNEEKHIIIEKGTEAPFTGQFYDFFDKGIYTCRQCGAPLFYSDSKFKSECGWPSFDDAIPDAVTQTPDPDGIRTEITCSKCQGHLGHIFNGEGFTPKNTRYCVNSISMDFITESRTETAIFASGCFWGVQYHLQKVNGVYFTIVGYIGGDILNPEYKQVCSSTTGHAEAVEVVFDPNQVSYEELTKVFFETHDPTQVGGQGPDIGDQYRSEIFYTSEPQKETALKLIDILKEKGYDVKTKLTKAVKFWPAELYHQNYYDKNGKQPYCHIYQKKF